MSGEFQDIGNAKLLGPKIEMTIEGLPGKFFVIREDMKFLIKGVMMEDAIRVSRIDDSQTTLFGGVPETAGGTAVLTHTKKSVRLLLPGRENEMILLSATKITKLENHDEDVIPISRLVRQTGAI